MLFPLKRSWLEIRLPVLAENYRICRACLPPGADVMAVVKANAYGHGDKVISAYLASLGVKHFAVSNLNEALALRDARVRGSILILGYTPVEFAAELYRNDFTQALVSEEYALSLAEQDFPVKCQFAIDTGMNRIGLDADYPEKCASVIRHFRDRLEINGIFTHLCVADSNTPENRRFTQAQIAKFQAVSEQIQDLQLPYIHCMNSAGGLFWSKEYESSLSRLVRLGIVLYGMKPDIDNELPEGIQPILTWKTVISMIKTVHAGESISYGRTFCAEHDMRIATLPTGYADGYSRSLSNRGYVLIHGKRAPIVGRICMDQMMADISDIPEAEETDEVILLGRSGNEVFTADDMAMMLGTIGYEVVCDINERVCRNYVPF